MGRSLPRTNLASPPLIMTNHILSAAAYHINPRPKGWVVLSLGRTSLSLMMGTESSATLWPVNAKCTDRITIPPVLSITSIHAHSSLSKYKADEEYKCGNQQRGEGTKIGAAAPKTITPRTSDGGRLPCERDRRWEGIMPRHCRGHQHCE